MFKLIQLSMAWLLLLYRDIILLLLWTDGGSVVVAEGDCGGWMVGRRGSPRISYRLGPKTIWLK